MWRKGEIGGFDYFIKQYEKGSTYGIDEGRISKMQILKDSKIIVNYDRGWEVEPREPMVISACEKLLEMYN